MPHPTDALVSTKLRPAHARANLVVRRRLTARMERDPGRKLTLVSAPAGFGKTTLLVEWLQHRIATGRLAVWVSLDEGDNDPARFLSYVVASLRTAREGIGQGVLVALRSPQPPRLDALTGVLINEIASIPDEIDIIFDDYHLIDAEAIHGIVAFLLERLPPNVHLIIGSRVNPPLPIARLRARHQLAELGAADLAFDLHEAAAFLNGTMGLSLSEEAVAALEERTEGWIAALHLAALSMRERSDVSTFIHTFSGGHRDVFDFLAEEVLERQTEQVRSFLLETSILDRLSGPLCDAVTGGSDGQQMLECLERENLLVVPLDDVRRWYRYHHLFADFLRGRLERERPGRLTPLHLRASAWCEENGLVSEAVHHALAAGDHERAARLIEQAVGQTWYRGEVVTLLEWLRKLPEEALRRRPLLMIWYAAGFVLAGRLDGVGSLLDEAERLIDAGDVFSAASSPVVDEVDRQHLAATAAAVRSQYARVRGDPHGSVEHARRAVALLPKDNLNPRPFAVIALAQAHQAAGDMEAASAAFAEAGALGQAAGHDYVALSAMTALAHLRLAQGRLREANDVLRWALGYAAERDAQLLPAVGSVCIGMGELLYEWDDLDGAARYLRQGVELAERTGDFEILMWGHIGSARVRWALGDAAGALAAAREAEQVARNVHADHTIVEAAVWNARLHLVRGDLVAAESEQERAAGVGPVRRSSHELERIGRARLLLTRNEHGEALRLLAQLHERARTTARTIEIQALQALALWASGQREQAVSVLTAALVLAEPAGYVRTFVDEGPLMAELLSRVLETQQRRASASASHVSVHYLRKLLAAFERGAGGAITPAVGMPEPLSERELEVLQLIAAGKTNREIATDLFVSEGTVKTHINNVYRKLDTHSRTQALARARELDLI